MKGFVPSAVLFMLRNGGRITMTACKTPNTTIRALSATERISLVIFKSTDEGSHLSERSFLGMIIRKADAAAALFSKKRKNFTSSVTLALYADFSSVFIRVFFTSLDANGCKL